MTPDELSQRLNENLKNAQEHARTTMRNMEVDALNRQQHADLMRIENQKLHSYEELVQQLQQNNEETHKEFELQEKKNKQRFWISASIAILSAIGAIISAIIAIISVCQ